MFRKILIASDGSADSSHAALTAESLGLLAAPARLLLVGALDQHSATLDELTDFRAKTTLPLRRLLAQKGLAVCWEEAKAEPPARAILALARRHRPDLIVVGRRALGRLERFFKGSVSKEVFEARPPALLIVPEEAPMRRPRDPALVALALEPSDGALCATARALAKAQQRPLALVHCCADSALPVPGSMAAGDPAAGFSGARRAYHEELRSALSERLCDFEAQGVDAYAELGQAPVAQGLNNVAKRLNAGLILIGSQERPWVDRLFDGESAWGIVEESSVPVLIARAAIELDGAEERTPVGLSARGSDS